MKKHFLHCFTLLFALLVCTTTVFTSCSKDDKNKNKNNNTSPLVGTWKGESTEGGTTLTVTYCFNADGTGWDNWNEEQEFFRWYTMGDLLCFYYKDATSSDGYDEDIYRFAINNGMAYIYEMDGKLLGIFKKQ